MDAKLTNKVQGMAGILDSSEKRILMLVREHSINIKDKQLLGTISSVLQLPNCDELVEVESWTASEINQQVKLPELDVSQQTEVYTMLANYKSVSSSGETDIGYAAVTEHHIKLTNDTPIFQRPHRFLYPVADEIEHQCQELNSLDIIEPSISPWSSPVVPVSKKDGSIRMCIDYR